MRGLLLFLLLAGCQSATPVAEPPPSPCSQREFEGSRFTVCDSKGGEIRLIGASPGETPLRSFADLHTSLNPAGVAFAMNAGMFDEAGRPIGLAIVDGQEVHAINRRKGFGNFHLLPNGVFLVRADGRAEAVATESFKPAADIRLATQSGPMLVIGGKLHPRIEFDGQSRNIRNGVGVRDGKALFVISKDLVSFGKLARFFRDDLKTPDALYFDGSVSSLWDPAGNRQDSHSPLGPMVVVLKPSA
ncbi:MAG TPA: phosphodiester glycosidase family protein [Sphingomicrobium sp.]|nr:phosphodiester glycosidase family protein [Sphingomicrobium sp.]